MVVWFQCHDKKFKFLKESLNFLNHNFDARADMQKNLKNLWGILTRTFCWTNCKSLCKNKFECKIYGDILVRIYFSFWSCYLNQPTIIYLHIYNIYIHAFIVFSFLTCNIWFVIKSPFHFGFQILLDGAEVSFSCHESLHSKGWIKVVGLPVQYPVIIYLCCFP